MVVRLSDDEARVDGRADVDDLAELFDTELGLEDEDEYDTVGGLIYHRIGGVPSPGDRVEVDGLTLTVESTDGRRVGKVLVGPRRRRPRRTNDGEPRTGRRSDGDRLGSRAPSHGLVRAAQRRTYARDHRDDDLLEAGPGLGRRRTPAASSSASASSRWRRASVAGEVAGAGPLEDRDDLGDVARAVGSAVAVERGEPLAVLGAGVLEGVDHRQRLLVAGDVGRLLAGRLLGAPDPEQVVVELEREPERPAERPIAGDRPRRRRSRAARRPRSRRRSAPRSCGRSCRSRARPTSARPTRSSRCRCTGPRTARRTSRRRGASAGGPSRR